MLTITTFGGVILLIFLYLVLYFSTRLERMHKGFYSAISRQTIQIHAKILMMSRRKAFIDHVHFDS